ncbi:uncharacterized protein [Setaria viridis]|uniref:uncharacterized protein n=1 Tax=Setaria viridis TaxID=4556 RepID=UPI001493AD42|nr:uncharacterized protein LOC117856490 [Setaria viridis]
MAQVNGQFDLLEELEAAEVAAQAAIHAGGQAAAAAGGQAAAQPAAQAAPEAGAQAAAAAGGLAAGVGGAGQQPRAAMRWTNVMSAFVLCRFCQLISTGVRTDKGFKEVHLNQVAKSVVEFSGLEVTGTQVYNHLRKWRQRWVRVIKLRELSGALWDDDNFMITLEDEHYKGHVQAYPKDAELLNKPIENYQQMEVIFGNGLATGKYAMGSSEPLGSPSDFADSENDHIKLDDMAGKGQPAGPLGSEGGNKRKRSMLSEGDILVMQGMTEAVNNVANAIIQTKVEDVHPDLYDAIMFMPGFTDEELMSAYEHLLGNKAHGTTFVKMNDSHRVLWLKTYLAKHFYMD